MVSSFLSLSPYITEKSVSLSLFLSLSLYYKDHRIDVSGFSLKCLSFLSDLNKNQNLSADFSKNIKFHENPSDSSRVVPCG